MEKIKKILFALGLSEDDLNAVENDEKTAENVAASIIDRAEGAIKTRIGEAVAEDKKSEIFNAVYNKIETVLTRNFSDRLDKTKYAGKKDKIKSMIEDLRAGFDEERAKLENAAAGDASEKLNEYRARLDEANKRARLDEANKLIDKVREDAAAAVAEKDRAFSQYKTDQVITRRKNSLLSSLQNSRFDTEAMNDIFEAERRRRNISFKIDDDGQTVIAVDAEGKVLRNPDKPSENLTINAVFDTIAKDRKFVKESQGREDTRRVTIEANGDGGGKMPAAFAEYLGKNGISL
jgi:hypothetical protein